ncbi:cell division protein ZapA [Oxalobacteraceae bacterium CAVE-383]|nr:cell division protein ZapA [Oxalobacteraceae bacterium CAVE-383]
MSQLDVMIMGQPYKLACKEGEEAALQQVVAYLDEKMCAVRDSGKVKGNDRITVMAALGIAAELLSTQSSDGATVAQWKQHIGDMHAVLDEALTPQNKLF